MLGLLWAEDQHGLIGANGQLPWHLPADLQNFKRLTTGHTIVMGRKTFASFKRPLPNRKHLVLSHNPDLAVPVGVTVLTNEAALQQYIAEHPDEEIFVIGGRRLFEMTLPMATDLYRTVIDGEFTGDVYMPPVDYQQWQLVSQNAGPVDAKNHYAHRYEHYQRRG